jgi:PAS domain S-box-containing protein
MQGDPQAADRMNTQRSNDTGERTDWLALAVRSAHVAVGVSSLRSGLFVDVNDAFCRLYLLRRDEVVGRSSAELGLWPDPQQRERLLGLLRRHGSVSGFQARYRNRLGETGEVEVSARIVDQDGEPFFIGFLTEFSDSRELVDGLRAAQSRLGVVLRSSQVLVFAQDHELRYTWVANPALGSTEHELLGRSDEEILGPEAAAPLVAIKRGVLASGRPDRRDVWVANGGQMGCFDLAVEPERDGAGRVVGIVCAAFDITQRMTAPAAPSLQVIQGLASLIDREGLSPLQAQRLMRIGAMAAQRHKVPGALPAREQLRQRHGGALVLVAEHNPVLRQLVAALLEQAGLRVALADSGVQAFSLAMQLSPALLLLDMELPQRGGVATARAVRAMVPRRVPLVAMMSVSPPLGAALALDADLDDVIDKPVAADRLYDKVLAWLDVA